MSKDKLDMSLEDIINMNKSGSGGRGSGRRNYPRRGRDSFGSRGRNDRPRGGVPGISRGGIQKRDNRNTYTKEIPDQWQHDLFEDTVERRRPHDDRRQSSDAKSGNLLISNLHFGVNDSDMKELFIEFGPVIKAAVHYDRSGRSLGTAEVVFEKTADAARAMKQYNNVSLDGQPMKITMMNDSGQTQSRSSLASRIGPSRSSDDYRPPRRQNGGRGRGGRGNFGDRQRRGSGGGGGGGGSGGRRDRTVPTKEQLDAELDAYNAKMQTD